MQHVCNNEKQNAVIAMDCTSQSVKKVLKEIISELLRTTETLKLANVVNLTKRAVRNDFSSSPETIVQRSWHCDFGKTKIRKPISLLSASAFCCFGHSLPVGSLNSCAYECWNIWREADSCFVHSACLA